MGVFWYCIGYIESLGMLGRYSMHRGIWISALTPLENGVILNDIGCGSHES